MTLAVVIPVRAGSKGVPGKNLARVGGRPLLDWTVEAALAARCVERGLVSTDSQASRAALQRTGVRISGRIGLWEMPEESYTEVDEPADLVIVDALLRRRQRPVAPVTGAERIRLVLTDVDGVLTDNGMTYSSDGNES